MPASRIDLRPDVAQWLAAFAAAVRDRDYAAGRALCADDVEGFGTVAERYVGLDRLEQEQWRHVWGRTVDFAFDLGTAVGWDAGDLVVVVAEWSSTGAPPDGAGRLRTGRSTIALRRDGVDLRAVHTHFSMAPGTLA